MPPSHFPLPRLALVITCYMLFRLVVLLVLARALYHPLRSPSSSHQNLSPWRAEGLFLPLPCCISSAWNHAYLLGGQMDEFCSGTLP